MCSASVKPAGTIQVSLEIGKTIPEDSLKLITEVILLIYATNLISRATKYIAIGFLSISIK